MNALGLKSKAAARLESSFASEPGANINIEGLEKTGKNHLAFTAPDPILCISGDRKVNHLASKFALLHKKRIHAVRFRYKIPLGADDKQVKEVAKPIWREIEELFWEAIESPKVRSIVIDTGSWLWETKRLAAFGKTTKVLPVFYALANAQFERMLLAGEETPGKHVIWLHKVGPEWKNREGDRGLESYTTGKMERKGFRNVGFDVQASIRTGYNAEKRRFYAKVIDNAFDPSLNGHVFKGKDLNYATIMSALTGTERSEWR